MMVEGGMGNEWTSEVRTDKNIGSWGIRIGLELGLKLVFW